MNTFELSRVFFDYCINNPDKIKTGNIALYYFIIDHCNRLGWPDKVGLPSYYAMSVLGIARYETYKSYLQTLVDCGFVNIVELSKNQYTSTVISLNGAKLKYSKPHSTAIGNQIDEQSESTPDSNSTIIKPKTLNLKPKTIDGSDKPNPIPKQQKEKIDFDILLKFFNETFEKKSPFINQKIKSKYNALLAQGYTKKQIGEAMVNASKDQYHIDTGYKYCTLEFFTRSDKVDKFANLSEVKPKQSKPEEQRSLRAELK